MTDNPELNIEAIYKTIHLLEKFDDEDKVVMGDWVNLRKSDEPYHGGVEGGFCNTTACAAGWAMLANRPEIMLPLLEDFEISRARAQCELGASTVLGLTKEQAGQLFLMNSGESFTFRLYVITDGVIVAHPLSTGSFDGLLTNRQRRLALIRVLMLLKDFGEVRWPQAIAQVLYDTNDDSNEKKIFIGL